MEKISLVTSIAPINIENQRRAMDTWIENGFTIISCNVETEIEQIQQYFPKIEFVKVKRDANDVVGRPCPYIYDMLKIAKLYTNEICGIVNSDIFLYNFSQEIYHFLYQKARESLIFARRNEITCLNDCENFNFQLFFGGVDLFIFNKKFIDLLQDDGLIIGQAMWDYWLPLMAQQNHIEIHELVNPLIFHITHPTKWSDDNTKKFSADICKNHYPQVPEEDAMYFLKNEFFKLISDIHIPICYLPDTLKNKKILYILGNGMKKGCIDLLKADNHNVCLSYENNAGKINISEYDYVINISYNVIVCHAFLDAVIWTLNQYNLAEMYLYAYFRGNREKLLIQENCNDYSVKEFNEVIRPIKIRKNTSIENGDNSSKNVRWCTAYLCSVFIEEREQIVLLHENIKGKVFLYPAGYMTGVWLRRYLKLANNIEVVGIADKNPILCGREMFGFKIQSPEVLSDIETYDKVLILSNRYSKEIYEELIKVIPSKKIYIWNELDGHKWFNTIECTENNLWTR